MSPENPAKLSMEEYGGRGVAKDRQAGAKGGSEIDFFTRYDI